MSVDDDLGKHSSQILMRRYEFAESPLTWTTLQAASIVPVFVLLNRDSKSNANRTY